MDELKLFPIKELIPDRLALKNVHGFIVLQQDCGYDDHKTKYITIETPVLGVLTVPGYTDVYNVTSEVAINILISYYDDGGHEVIYNERNELIFTTQKYRPDFNLYAFYTTMVVKESSHSEQRLINLLTGSRFKDYQFTYVTADKLELKKEKVELIF